MVFVVNDSFNQYIVNINVRSSYILLCYVINVIILWNGSYKENRWFLIDFTFVFYNEIKLCKWCEDLYNVITAFRLRLYVCNK